MSETDYLICMFVLCLPVVREGICHRLAVASERADCFGDFLLTLLCREAPDRRMEKTISQLRPALFSRVVFACSPVMLTLFTCCIVNQLVAALQSPSPLDGALILISCALIGLIYGVLFFLDVAVNAVRLPTVSTVVPPEMSPRFISRFSQLTLSIPTPPPRSVC